MKIKYVLKGERILLDCQGGVALKPAPTDGYSISNNGNIIFVTDEELVDAWQHRPEQAK